jgi:hypothetical protein
MTQLIDTLSQHPAIVAAAVCACACCLACGGRAVCACCHEWTRSGDE